MPNREIHNDIAKDVALNIAAISTNTTTNGVIIDTQAYDAIEFAMQSGTLTDGAYTPLIEDGDDSGLSDAAAVVDAELTNTEASAAFAAADDNKIKSIGYLGGKRYVRLSVISTGVTTGGTLGATVLKGRPSHLPVINNA